MSGPKKTSIPPKIGISNCKGCRAYPNANCPINNKIVFPYSLERQETGRYRYGTSTTQKNVSWCWFNLEDIIPLGELGEELYE
jgi:hypothetical protein